MEFNNEKNTVKLTVTEANKISGAIRAIDPAKKNKLSYAATRLNDRLQSAIKSYETKAEELSVEYSAKDDKGDFKYVPGTTNYSLKPDKIIEYNTKLKELQNTHILEIELYKCKDLEEINKLEIPVIYTLNTILFDYDFDEYETKQN